MVPLLMTACTQATELVLYRSVIHMAASTHMPKLLLVQCIDGMREIP